MSKLPEPEVSDRQPDDGGLVQLRRDGVGKREHLGQLVELVVLLAAPGSGCVARLLLPQLQNSNGVDKGEKQEKCNFIKCPENIYLSKNKLRCFSAQGEIIAHGNNQATLIALIIVQAI